VSKKIVAIGGGTGTSALTSEIKNEEGVEATAVVAVSDDGRSSKKIRDHYEVVAVGDVRNVIESLIPDSEIELREMMGMRIHSQNGVGFLDGHPQGNIELLMAIKYFKGDIVKAIQSVMRKYRALHTVLPITADCAHLEAWMDDGSVMEREGVIDSRLKDNPDDTRRIMAVYLRPMATILPDAEWALLNADTIVVCAGSTFTSIGACFSVQGVAQAVRRNTKAKFVQVMNLMTNANESPDWTASQHAENVYQAVTRPFDYVICNDHKLISPEVALAYEKEGARPVVVDRDRLSCYAKEVIVGDFADEQRGPVRHNAKLAKRIIEL
jgi:uncharacterized cofD-like protein